MIVRFKEKAFFKSFFVICCRKRNKIGSNNIVNESAIWFQNSALVVEMPNSRRHISLFVRQKRQITFFELFFCFRG